MDNPLVVFAPGLGLDADEWKSVRDRLEGPSTVVTLPSMGQRARRRLDLRVEAQAARLAHGLPAGRPTVLVAHSAGCPVAAETARTSPGVIGMVLVGPVTDPAAASWPALFMQWVRTVAHEPMWQLPGLARQWRRTGPVSMFRGMNAIRPFRTDVALQAVEVPVVIVRGRHDHIAAREWSEALARASGGHLTTVDGAAHMVPTTRPDAVIAAVGQVMAGRHRSPPIECRYNSKPGQVLQAKSSSRSTED